MTPGTIVHYTAPEETHGTPPSDLPQVLTTRPQHPTAEQPPASAPQPPRVLGAVVTQVNDPETGDVALRVWYPTSVVIVPSCLPSKDPAGAPGSKGKWTPVDRPPATPPVVG